MRGPPVRENDDPLIEFPSEATEPEPARRQQREEPLLVFAPPGAPSDPVVMTERGSRRLRISPLARLLCQCSATVIARFDRFSVQAWQAFAASKTGFATAYRARPRLAAWTEAQGRSTRARFGRGAAHMRAAARFIRQLNSTAVALFHRLGMQILRAFSACKGGFAAARQTWPRPVAWPWGDRAPSTRPFALGILVGGLLVGSERLIPDQSVTALAPANPTAATRPEPAQSPPADLLRGLAVSTRAEQRMFAKHVVATVGTASPRNRALPAPKPERGRQQPQPFRGSLRVTSTPAGAAVLINGLRAGTTPVVLRDLPVGSRAVRVSLEGYDRWSRAVQVVANRRTEVNAILTVPRPIRTASVESE